MGSFGLFVASRFAAEFGSDLVEIFGKLVHKGIEVTGLRAIDELELLGIEQLEQVGTLVGGCFRKLNAVEEQPFHGVQFLVPSALAAPNDPGLGLEHIGLPVKADPEEDRCAGGKGIRRHDAGS